MLIQLALVWYDQNIFDAAGNWTVMYQVDNLSKKFFKNE